MVDLMNDLHWNPETYRRDVAFVHESAEDLVSWFAPRKGEDVLDLGCGTGELTARIADHGARVVGVDASESMLAGARRSFPSLDVRLGDGHALPFEQEFDGVFSNAALHWMTRPDEVVHGVRRALRPAGRFVFEMPEETSIARTLDAFDRGLVDVVGRPFDRGRWYFARLGDQASRLERAGFQVVSAHSFERPSFVADRDGTSGLAHWFELFTGDFLASLGDARAEVLARVEHHAAELRSPGGYTLDYVRLRMKAFAVG